MQKIIKQQVKHKSNFLKKHTLSLGGRAQV